MDPLASHCTSPDRPATCAPDEPARFVSCDGPHSGAPDDQRPPHWLDVIHEGLVSTRLGGGSDRTPVAAATWVAGAWAGYGFTAADLSAWVAAGITEPAVAVECRAVGFDPHEEADRAFLRGLEALDVPWGLVCWAEALDAGDVSAEAAWEAYKGAP